MMLQSVKAPGKKAIDGTGGYVHLDDGTHLYAGIDVSNPLGKR